MYLFNVFRAIRNTNINAKNLWPLTDKFSCKCTSLPPCVFNIETLIIDPVSDSAIELLGVPIYTSSSKLKQVYYAVLKSMISKKYSEIASYGKLGHRYIFNNAPTLVSVIRTLRLVL